MKSIRAYREYLSQNPSQYWFRRKSFGWGGGCILVYSVTLIPSVLTANSAYSGSDALFKFAVPLVFFTSLLLAVCYITGEYPK